MERGEWTRRRARKDAAVSSVDTAMTGALEFLLLGDPLHLTTEVSTGRRHRANLVLAIPHQEHGFPGTGTVPAIDARNRQHTRNGLVRLEIAGRAGPRPSSLRGAGSGAERKGAEHRGKAGADQRDDGIDEDDEGASPADRSRVSEVCDMYPDA